MKKLLLFTGIAYGLYKLFKNLGSRNNKHTLTTEVNNTNNDLSQNGWTKNKIKSKVHHGDIRGFMKKAGSISHHLDEASNI